MFRQIYTPLIGFLILIISGCQGTNLPYLVIINQSPQEQDLRLVIADQVVFEKLKVPPKTILDFQVATGSGTAILSSKPSVAAEWTPWLNSEDKPFNCLLENGQLHLLTIESEGKTNFRKLHGTALSGPQVAFINSSGRKLAIVQVSKNVNENIEVYHQDMVIGAVTNLYKVDPGIYSVFWQIPGRMDPVEAQYLMNENGDPAKHSFLPGHTYFFWITEDQMDSQFPTQLYDFHLVP